MRIALLAVTTGTWVLSAVPVSAADAPKASVETVAGPAAQQMDRYVEALVPFGFHGTVLAAQHGRILLHRAYGVADPTTGRPNTIGTMFSTGSVTKQFTATAIMKLASEGRLAVNDPLSRFVDGVPPDKEPITLHHLLTHTAGLRPAYGDDLEVVARDDLVRRIMDEPLMHGVGERYEYSNAGYTLLAVVVETVTGKPYEDYLRDTFYRPLGMASTGLTSIDIDRDRVARAHAPDQDFPSPADRPRGVWNLYGNGGQLSTTGDMYRWVTALRGNRLLPPGYTRRMLTGYADEDPDGRCRYGYGWVICESSRGGEVIWHNGGASGLWSCAVYQYVDDDALFIVFTNSTIAGQPPVDHLCMNLSKIIAGERVDMPPALDPGAHVDASRVAGTWHFGDGVAVEVAPADGGVVVSPLGPDAMLALYPSPMNDMLTRYNRRTMDMIDAMRRGDFETAGGYVDMPPPGRSGAEWLREWWQSVDGIDSLERVELLGTRFADGARTHVRLHLPGGPRDYCFYWMMGRCEGLSAAPAPARILRASKGGTFVAFAMDGGVELEFDGDGAARLTAAGRELKGTRIAR